MNRTDNHNDEDSTASGTATTTPTRSTLETDDAPEATLPPFDYVPESSEGNPNTKMGTSYTPAADEDHAMKAHSIGARNAIPPHPDTPPTPAPASGNTDPQQTASSTANANG